MKRWMRDAVIVLAGSTVIQFTVPDRYVLAVLILWGLAVGTWSFWTDPEYRRRW